MCDMAAVSGAGQMAVWVDDTARSVTWWYPDGGTITRVDDVVVVDPGDDAAHLHCADPVIVARYPGSAGVP
jgi:hypothetical protein